jgi:hypothetical protein
VFIKSSSLLANARNVDTVGAPRMGGAVALFSNLGAFTGVVDPRGGFAFSSASPASSIVASSASSRPLTGGAMTLATTRTRA